MKERSFPMKAAEIFEVCHARYCGLRDWLGEAIGQVRAMSIDGPSPGYHWKPSRARASEYVADFERLGRQTLRRPEWKGRLKVFEVYYLEGVEYRRAIALVGVAPGTFDYWMSEVKKAVGRECLRAGLFPPGKYFRG